MKNFKDVLMDSYLKGQLKHNYSSMCALYHITGTSRWIDALNGTFQVVYEKELYKIPQSVLKVFTPKELLEIEYAFEGREFNGEEHERTLTQDNDPDGYKGLLKAFEVLEFLRLKKEKAEMVIYG